MLDFVTTQHADLLSKHTDCVPFQAAFPRCVEPDHCPVTCCFGNKHREGCTNTPGSRAKNMPQHVTACPNTYLGPSLISSPPNNNHKQQFSALCILLKFLLSAKTSDL